MGDFGLLGSEAARTQKGIDLGLVAAEFHIKFHGVGAAAGFEYIFTERLGGSGVKHTFFLEQFETVAVKHFGPEIGVIT